MPLQNGTQQNSYCAVFNLLWFKGGVHNNFVNPLSLLIIILFEHVTNRHYNQSQLSYFSGCISMVSFILKNTDFINDYLYV